jgi:acetyl-CoA C-acetyltransferase
LAAGLGKHTTCTTINKVCASGMKAIMYAAQSIMLGDSDIVVAGGMESMSNAPHYLPTMRNGVRYGNTNVIDAIVRDGLQDPYDGSMMGNCAEVCATGKGFSREDQDAFAWESYQRARTAHTTGAFTNEIAPIDIVSRTGTTTVSRDEEVDNNRITGLDSLAKMRPAFDKNGTVTAGNASKINDGAAAVVLMSKEKADALGIKPIAKISGFADAEQEPVWFTTTPALAMPKAMAKAGWTVADVDAFEINEAFAVVTLANTKELGLDPKKVNILGGACAIGHPIGASGARLVITLISALRQNGGKRGIASICNGGGGASAIAIELV